MTPGPGPRLDTWSGTRPGNRKWNYLITWHQLFYHEFVQLVLVEGVQLHAAVVEAGVEATEGRENGEAVVLVDQMTTDVLHGDHNVL